MAQRGRPANLSLRTSILSLLEQGPQTVAFCASECCSNPVTTKNHIRAMVNLGLVTESDEPTKNINPETGEPSRGRPSYLYSISEAGRAALSLEDTASALVAPAAEVVAEVSVEASVEADEVVAENVPEDFDGEDEDFSEATDSDDELLYEEDEDDSDDSDDYDDYDDY